MEKFKSDKKEEFHTAPFCGNSGMGANILSRTIATESLNFGDIEIGKGARLPVMGLIEKMQNLAMREPKKTLVKLGVVHDNGIRTPDGDQMFRQWQFEQEIGKEESKFLGMCKKILKEQEKED